MRVLAAEVGVPAAPYTHKSLVVWLVGFVTHLIVPAHVKPLELFVVQIDIVEALLGPARQVQ
jgi:hypothetical protein